MLVCGCMNELKVVHEVRSTEVCEVWLTKYLMENQPRLGKVQENLWFSVATCVPLMWASSSCWGTARKSELETLLYAGRTRRVGGYQTVAGEPELLWEGHVIVQPSYPLCRIGLLDSKGGPNQVVIEFDLTDVSSCGGVTSVKAVFMIRCTMGDYS